MSDLISRESALLCLTGVFPTDGKCDISKVVSKFSKRIKNLPSEEPQIIRCKECKYNPKYEWFGCPMSHLSEKQRPETAWCWKAERRTDG